MPQESRRRSAAAARLWAQKWRYYDANASYRGTPPPALPAPVVPRTGAPGYAIALQLPEDDPSRFVLIAVRPGALHDDRCGDLTYDDLGRKGLAPGTSEAGLTVAACWR